MGDEGLLARYTEVPYRLGAHFQSHPARVAAIARLLGHPAPALDRARVLELGCGHGFNLLPLAAAFPEAEFFGMDLLAPAIAEGRELIAAAGLGNIRLEQADLRRFAPEPESYDYVIAHGVFSWVEDDVKAALLACCRRALKQDGVAYVSYNTYPGWKLRESVRDLLQLRLNAVEGADCRRDAAQDTLRFLQTALASNHREQAVALRSIITEMAQKNPTTFYHDEMGEINDPCYLLQFVEWAREHDLHYLGDAQFSSMLPDALPRSASAELARLAPDQVQFEQLMDYVRQRTFRSTLLCRGTAAPQLTIHPEVLRDCAFGSMLRSAVSVPDLREGLRTRFADGSKLSLQTEKSGVKALLSVLASAWPRRLPFAEAASAARRLLHTTGVAVPEDLEAQLVSCLLDLCARGAVDFLMACGLDCASRLPPVPCVDALTRAAAARGLPMINVWHETHLFDPATSHFLTSLDGSSRPVEVPDQPVLRLLMEAGFLRPG